LVWIADIIDQAAGWWAPGVIVATHSRLVTISQESGPLRLATGALMAIPILAAGVRCLHDVDRSGWWILLLFVNVGIASVIVVPWLNDGGDWLFVPAHTLNWFATSLFPPSILLFYWWSAKGFLGSNRFGPAASPAPRWLFRTDTSTPARAAQTA